MIGISWYFGYKIDPEERVKLLKKYGFDCVITNADKKFNSQNGNIKKQIKLFKKYDINLSSLHMQYKAVDLPHFWLNDKRGEILVKTMIKDVQLAKKYGFNTVVVHLKGKYSNLGLERLKRVLKVCEKYDINLAVENLCTNKDILQKVFKNIKHKNLKFCYDAGHHNIWIDDVDLLKEY